MSLYSDDTKQEHKRGKNGRVYQYKTVSAAEGHSFSFLHKFGIRQRSVIAERLPIGVPPQHNAYQTAFYSRNLKILMQRA